MQLVEKSLWAEADVLADLRRAFDGGAQAMEIDARLDADGNFVVAHGTRSPSGRLIAETNATGLGDAVPLAAALALLASYPAKRLVVEVKTLGRHAGQEANARHLADVVAAAGVAGRVSISSLSPAILLAVHRVWPAVPLILNGALAPVISYPDGPVGRCLARRLASHRGYWRIGVKGRYIVLASGAGALAAARDNDAAAARGETIYVLTELPAELAAVLCAQRAAGVVCGGAVSVANVTTWCNALRRLGLRVWPQRIGRRIVATVHKLGLNVQTTTWGAINSATNVAVWRPENQIKQLLAEGLGPDDIVYTRGIGPALWSAIEERN